MNETEQALVFGAAGGFLAMMLGAVCAALWRGHVRRRKRRNAQMSCRQRLPSEDWD